MKELSYVKIVVSYKGSFHTIGINKSHMWCLVIKGVSKTNFISRPKLLVGKKLYVCTVSLPGTLQLTALLCTVVL